MRVTERSEIKARAVSFADGAGGYFRQEYEVTYGPSHTPLGVTAVVEGRRRQTPDRSFFAGGRQYPTLGDAVRAAGHSWEVAGLD